jgi:lactoylglutathione lyase
MNSVTTAALAPSRILYPMIRVSDLERSLAFYTEALGMRELRRENFTDGRFTLVFIGYDEEASSTVLELTYNWDARQYEHGTGYGHLALEVADIFGTCARISTLGVKIVRDPGPMMYAADESGEREVIAFIEDPDGFRIELISSCGRGPTHRNLP